jgi:hypothetical protein
MIMSMKNFLDLTVCSEVPQPLRHQQRASLKYKYKY